MPEFWKWMTDKDYGHRSESKSGHELLTVYDARKTGCKATKQMLVGYKIEYCLEHDIPLEFTKFSIEGENPFEKNPILNKKAY